MRYMLLIYENENNEPGDLQRWFDYTEEMGKAGVMNGGEALHPTSTATTVRVKNGEPVTTDGPFAETREQLGGYYIIDCKDLDEAIRWAAKMPNADRGSIEIRPVMEFDQG
ncbi:MAG TPA: YciI family protein [Longimicrobiales bacterium]|nr:YciI family protein [Longimicrobiales bacterium]